MAQIFKNNTWGLLASELASGATTATLNAGHGFTDPGTDWYLATLIGVTGTTETAWEIVKVTDVSTNTLTLVRAQEGTADATWPAGTRLELRLTAGATESKANLGTAAYKAVGTGSSDVAAGDHAHASLYQPLDSDLTALAGLSTTGLIERTGAGTAGTVTKPSGAIVGTTDTQTLTNKTLTAPEATNAKLTTAREAITVSATQATGTINYDCLTQAILYYTSDASGNFTINFKGKSDTTLNAMLAIGEALTVAFLVTNGASNAYYNSAVQVDGNSVTPKWQGGTAPAAGNKSSIDAYSYTIIKTANATFTVLAALTQFK